MVFVACHSVLFCVGGMEHSDSESDFELHEVDPMVDGFSDDFSGAAPSAAVAHASSSVSNVKKQTTITTFFK